MSRARSQTRHVQNIIMIENTRHKTIIYIDITCFNYVMTLPALTLRFCYSKYLTW